jgi:hypothetical protein
MGGASLCQHLPRLIIPRQNCAPRGAPPKPPLAPCDYPQSMGAELGTGALDLLARSGSLCTRGYRVHYERPAAIGPRQRERLKAVLIQ